MPELHDLTALEQGRAIAGREISAVELAEHYLARSGELADQIGAFVRLTPELALEQAAAADVATRAGEVGSPLRGVVCPVKDLDSVAGIPTKFGTAAIELTMDFDANVVAAMRTAGLVFTGKTATPELGLPCYTEPDGAPPARTPWDLTRSASGSSGGAAAAVAAGLAPIAQGSDGGGSIRLPAAVCGLVGIKPSRGRISNGPMSDGVGDLAVYGPLARTVRDAAALLDVMAVPFVGDPFRAAPVAGTFLAAAERAPGRLRIGYYLDPVVGQTPPTPAVVAALEATATLLAQLGHEVEAVPAPPLQDAVPVFEVVWSALADSVPLSEDMVAQLTPLTRHLRARGQGQSAGDLAAAVSQMRGIARAALRATERFDVLLSPTAAAEPFEVGALRDDADPAGDFEAQKQWASYTAIYNVTGQPSVNVPINWTAEGLPVGVQVAGRRDDEATLISLCAQLEEAQPWQTRRPSLW